MERRTLFIIAFAFLSLGISIELLKNLSRTSRTIKKMEVARASQLGDYDVNLGAENVAANSANVTGFRGIKPIKGVPLAQATAVDNKKTEKKR